MATAIAPTTIPSQIRNHPFIDWNDPENARVNFSLRLANAFFANSWCSDVSIYVPMDDRTIPAHSFVLATASPVLQGFCFGSGGIEGNKVITVPDYCTTDVVMVVLRYLYIGGTAEGVSESNAALVFKIADYLELCSLQKQCKALITETLSLSNVCNIYSTIHLVGTTNLVDQCMNLMQSHTKEILQNDTAMEMENAALAKLFGTNVCLTTSSETDILVPMIKWADANCLRQFMDVTPENRRIVLGDRVKLIRFGLMKPSEFAEAIRVCGKGFLSDKEMSMTFYQISLMEKSDSNNPNLFDDYPFSSVPRLHVVNGCLENILQTADGWQFANVFNFAIDVAHMKKPFKLTAISILNQNNIQFRFSYSLAPHHVSNKNIVAFADSSYNKINFSGSGSCPYDAQHIFIKLTFKTNVMCYGFNQNQKSLPNKPTVIGTPYNVIDKIYYTCPQ